MTTSPDGRRSSDQRSGRRSRGASPAAAASRPRLELPTWLYPAIGLVLIAGLSAFAWFEVAHRGVFRDDAPSWAPDSGRVAYTSQHDGREQVCVMNADGTGARAVTTGNADSRAPAWSPSGSRLAFASDRDGNFDIYVADPSGAHLVRVTRDRARDDNPSWSPDGRSIAFLSTRNGATPDIFLMNADGTGAARLTTTGAMSTPQFSPEGRRIVFEAPHGIAVLELATRKITVLPLGARVAHEPSWSPDGQRITFSSDTGGHTQIFAMSASGTDVQSIVLLPAAAAISPRWSPDGLHIAFVSAPSDPAKAGQPSSARGIYTVAIADGQVRRLSR